MVGSFLPGKTIVRFDWLVAFVIRVFEDILSVASKFIGLAGIADVGDEDASGVGD